jgi:predicted ATPase
MLESLEIRSFKAFARATVPLGPFTVLVGPNGAGKTSVLQAIDLLGGVVKSSISEYLTSHDWAYSDLPHLRSPDTQIGFTATLRQDGAPLQWQLTLGARRYPGIAAEAVVAIGGESPSDTLLARKGRSMWRLREPSRLREAIRQTLPSSWLSAIDEDADRSSFPSLVRVAHWARQIRGFFFLDPLKLRAPGRGEAAEIGTNGENLAPFLARLQDHAPKAFRRLVDRVRQHYPRLVAVEPRRTKYGWTRLEIKERWNSEVTAFNARQMSDGLLRLLAVSAMHEIKEPPSVLLLDEIENGLHPRLLGGFVAMLQELSRGGRTQVIAATHSPITVNYCEAADHVLIVARDAGGGAQVTPLSRTRNFEKLRQQLDPGELWYNVGEERLLR